MSDWLLYFGLFLAVFFTMEGVAWLLHRYVMHGFLWVLHKSHHEPRKSSAWELNDAFGLFFAAISIALFAWSAQLGGPRWAFFVALGVTAYGVLSRGLLSSTNTTSLVAGDFRAHSPRFQGDNLKRNQDLAAALEAIAKEKNTTTAQLAIAWALSRGDDIIPLIGARSRKRLTEALAALQLKLTPEDLKRIELAVPAEQVAGTRYDARQMGMLDSERKSG